MKIGIVAPSSKVPSVEFKLGIERLRKEGFTVQVHPQCLKSHLFFAGTDNERSTAFFEYAKNPSLSALWCARGGHGSIRLLPLLEKMTSEQGIPPKKLLVGYSDATALMEFVRQRWGWSTLHAPMPSLRKFTLLGETDWQAMKGWILGETPQAPWAKQKLKFLTEVSTVGTDPSTPHAIEGKLVGGNLTVWNALLGTRFQGKADHCLLFLEDVDEGLYRVDRAVQQLLLSGSLNQVRAIILGNFLNCKDHVVQVLKTAPSAKRRTKVLTSPTSQELRPLRKTLHEVKTLRLIFKELGETLRIPVVEGLPVGHGPGVSPLPLGAEYQLSQAGYLSLINWDWTTHRK